MKKNTRVYLAAFALFAAGLGWLCFGALKSNSVYFLNVAEACAAAPDKLRQARLFGVVGTDALSREAATLKFKLLDKDNAGLHIPVVYSGAVPDAFKPGAEVIVEGGMDAAGKFSAKTLMTKCPSKYQKENRTL